MGSPLPLDNGDAVRDLTGYAGITRLGIRYLPGAIGTAQLRGQPLAGALSWTGFGHPRSPVLRSSDVPIHRVRWT
jgi:hypothetical protein